MTFTDADHTWMRRALKLARQAEQRDEVPIGAVLVDERGDVLGEGHNAPRSAHDPTAHAEIQALRAAAAKAEAPRLPGSTMYVTLEPCLMCIGALVHARVAEVVFAAADPKLGATAFIGRLPLGPEGLNHRLAFRSGLLADESAALLKRFFERRR